VGFWDDVTGGGVLTCIGQVFGRKDTTVQNPVAYEAEVTRSQSFVQKSNSNTLLYIGMGGIGLILMMFMLNK